ncbi:radical SAM protein [Frankia sp. CcI49]|nr:radical SAM protein [Frankia sp. CcI49]
MSTATAAPAEAAQVPRTLALEVTGRCQLECSPCYAGSGPKGDHGTMTVLDWCSLIDVAARAGIPRVRFIGGEPTLFPGLADLVRYALDAGLKAEVFTNLVRVTAGLWDVFGLPGVRVATSYYSPDPAWHDRVTGRPGSHAHTRANIITALERGILLRVGLINTGTQADVDAAHAELLALGVKTISRDDVRPLGRAAHGAEPNPAALCGGCGISQATVLPNGELVACGMGRWLSGGNVRDTPLNELFAGERWREALASIPRPIDAEKKCIPKLDGEDCAPAEEAACGPDYPTWS